jgi:aminoglycoside phosphotransferase family enzyme/predicted kinase
VALSGTGAELVGEGDRRAVDYVVEMVRYAERDTLAARLSRGELERRQVVAVGRRLAAFHAEARVVAAPAGPARAVERVFARNLHELSECVQQSGELARLQSLGRFAHAFVTGHGRTLAARAAAGRCREGHGDLRAEHVLLDGQEVSVVDCVEFDPGLRELDVADDLAFLVCDLAAQGGERFDEVLVRAYREAGGDPGPDALLAFYCVYRALVRAKVSLLRAAQEPAQSSARAGDSAHARDLITLAERFAWRARLPLAIVVCGLPASGKSTLARGLSELAGLPHVSSDRTRKALAGLRATRRAPPELYNRDWNARTYSELGRRAARELARRGGVIVDGTFRHAVDRQAFAAGFQEAAPMLFVECRAPRALLLQRAGRRERRGASVSDADARVVLAELERWEPLDEVEPDAHLTLRTDRRLEQITADVLALLDQRMLELAS